MSMKIYVDSNEKKKDVLKILSESRYCPENFKLKRIKNNKCDMDTQKYCEECWTSSGLEIIVGEKDTDAEKKQSNSLSDLKLFAEMMGKAADRYGKQKLEKRNNILENRCKHLKAFIESEIGLCEEQIERVFENGLLTFNDKRFLLGLPEVGDPNSLGEKEVKSLNEWINC